MNLTLGIAYVAAGLLIAGLCWPLKQRKIKPNRWYGFRFREAFQGEELWYRINEYGARRMLPWATFLMLVGVVPLAYGVEAPGRGLLCDCLYWIPLVLLYPALQSFLFARSLANESRA